MSLCFTPARTILLADFTPAQCLHRGRLLYKLRRTVLQLFAPLPQELYVRNYANATPRHATTPLLTTTTMTTAEHTWGKDVKTFLHDWTNWSNAKFQKQRLTAANFLDIEVRQSLP